MWHASTGAFADRIEKEEGRKLSIGEKLLVNMVFAEAEVVAANPKEARTRQELIDGFVQELSKAGGAPKDAFDFEPGTLVIPLAALRESIRMFKNNA